MNLEQNVAPLRISGAFRAWRVRRAQRKLAGLKAKLAAVREIVAMCKGAVPSALVLDMLNIPQEIAEIEALLRQLKAHHEA